MELRKFIKLLAKNGYEKVRQTGGHKIYKNAAGNVITINNRPNKMVVKRLIKENCLA